MSGSVAVPWPGLKPAVAYFESTTSALSKREADEETPVLELEEAGLRLRVPGEAASAAPNSIRSVMRDFSELLELPENWDTYGAQRIEPRVLEHVAEVLWSLGQTRKTPDLFPVNHGGVQLEWRSDAGEVEIEILPSGELEVLCEEVGQAAWEEQARLGSEGAREILRRLQQLIPED